jgi:DNA-directed RNA polymerase specialized sigma24 family protein
MRFGGLSVEETATALGVSADTVKRDWRIAKLWLLKAIHDGTHPQRLTRD